MWVIVNSGEDIVRCLVADALLGVRGWTRASSTASRGDRSSSVSLEEAVEGGTAGK